MITISIHSVRVQTEKNSTVGSGSGASCESHTAKKNYYRHTPTVETIVGSKKRKELPLFTVCDSTNKHSSDKRHPLDAPVSRKSLCFLLTIIIIIMVMDGSYMSLMRDVINGRNSQKLEAKQYGSMLIDHKDYYSYYCLFLGFLVVRARCNSSVFSRLLCTYAA